MMVHVQYANDSEQEKRRALFRALTSRVLSPEELLEVGRYGGRLNIEPMVSYNAMEKLAELQVALSIQQLLAR